MQFQKELQETVVQLESKVRELQPYLQKIAAPDESSQAGSGPLLLAGKGVSEQIAGDLEAVRTLMEGLKVKLNVVIVGQFNSGKSTFINSLVERKIAMVDETEMTYSLNFLTYHQSEHAVIHFQNHSQKEDTIENVNQLLISRRDDNSFRDSIAKIEFGYPYQELDSINIWDTPGLGSLNQANRERTISIIDDSDVVLWVIDGTGIGDLADRLDMERVLQLNKPVIALINKMDQIDEADAAEQISEYLKEHYAGFFKTLFFISAQKHWEALKHNSDNDSSGITEVKRYLEEEIFRKKQEIAALSLFNNIGQKLQSLLETFESLKDYLEGHLQKYDQFIAALQERTAGILDKLEQDLHAYVKAHVYQSEFEELLHSIEKGIVKIDNSTVLNQIFAGIFTEQATGRYIEDAERSVNQILRGAWEIAVGESADVIREQTTSFTIHQASEQVVPEKCNMISHDMIRAVQKVICITAGAKIGGGTGIICGSAIHAGFLKLMALTGLGAAAGIGLGLWVFKKSGQDPGLELREKIVEIFHNYQDQFYEEIVVKGLMPEARRQHERLCQFIEEKAMTQYLVFQPLSVNHKVLEIIAGCTKCAQGSLNKVAECQNSGSGDSDLFRENLRMEDFIILRVSPNDGLEKLRLLMAKVRRYVYIVDPYFRTETLAWISSVSSQVSVKILLSHLDEEVGEHNRFLTTLKTIRQNREAPMSVRLIKYQYKASSPIHDRYIFTENWALNLGNGLDAAGKQDITCGFLSDHRKFQTEFFEKYWNSSRLKFPNKEEVVLVHDL